MKEPIREAVGFVMVKGWSFNTVRPLDSHSIFFQQKMVCLHKPFLKKQLERKLTQDEIFACYEPEVIDLTKVEIKTELQVGSKRQN